MPRTPITTGIKIPIWIVFVLSSTATRVVQWIYKAAFIRQYRFLWSFSNRRIIILRDSIDLIRDKSVDIPRIVNFCHVSMFRGKVAQIATFSIYILKRCHHWMFWVWVNVARVYSLSVYFESVYWVFSFANDEPHCQEKFFYF